MAWAMGGAEISGGGRAPRARRGGGGERPGGARPGRGRGRTGAPIERGDARDPTLHTVRGQHGYTYRGFVLLRPPLLPLLRRLLLALPLRPGTFHAMAAAAAEAASADRAAAAERHRPQLACPPDVKRQVKRLVKPRAAHSSSNAERAVSARATAAVQRRNDGGCHSVRLPPPVYPRRPLHGGVAGVAVGVVGVDGGGGSGGGRSSGGGGGGAPARSAAKRARRSSSVVGRGCR